MWHPFKKRAAKAEAQEPANDDTITEVEEITPEEVAPTPAELAQDIQELLARIAETEKPSPTERSLLQKAFDKAARTVLADAEVATDETLTAFVEKTPSFEDEELRSDGIARLGWIAAKYPQVAEEVLPILASTVDHANAEIREAGLNGITTIGESNPDQMAKAHALLSEGLESRWPDVRTKAISGLTTLTMKNVELGEETVTAFAGMMTSKPDPDDKRALQEYQGRIAAARKLGELALTFDNLKDAAVAGLKPGLKDENTFVIYRTVEALTEIGKKYDDTVDGIVDAMKEAKEGQIYIVQEKLSTAMNTIKPPPKPVKTAEEIEAERKAEEARAKAAEEAAKKAAAESAKKTAAEKARKDRFESIKTLANKLPGKAI